MTGLRLALRAVANARYPSRSLPVTTFKLVGRAGSNLRPID